MDAKFLTSLFEGDSPVGAKLCQGLTGGDFWARKNGCQILYRCADVFDEDQAEMAAVADRGACDISAPAWLEHSPSRDYWYRVQSVSPGGCGDLAREAVVLIRCDEKGELRAQGEKVNGVFEMAASRVSNQARLEWLYRLGGIDIREFVIYSVDEAGRESRVAAVRYSGRHFYTWQGEALCAPENRFIVKSIGYDGTPRDTSETVRINVSNVNAGTSNHFENRISLTITEQQR